MVSMVDIKKEKITEDKIILGQQKQLFGKIGGGDDEVESMLKSLGK